MASRSKQHLQGALINWQNLKDKVGEKIVSKLERERAEWVQGTVSILVEWRKVNSTGRDAERVGDG